MSKTVKGASLINWQKQPKREKKRILQGESKYVDQISQ